MARKSRVYQEGHFALLSPKVYSTALYVRLSVLNGGKKDNDTAQNQEALLRQFIDGKPEFALFSVYVDNGETGVDFKRSEFERLLGDVREKKVNCIIVKDLSRFGRNYIEAGEYLEQLFPLLGVRFIAINDRYDTLNPGAADLLRMHLKNLVNDVYARDISRKICPVLRMKQECGDFIGSWAPYGYRIAARSRDGAEGWIGEGGRKRLEIDPETAPIVRDIFRWRWEGWPYQAIVWELLEQGIPSPSRYRYEKGVIKDEKLAQAVWKPTTVTRMLSNQVYLGHMVQGKKRAALWNNQAQVAVPEADWIVVLNTHEAIIEESVFKRVQEIDARVAKRRG